MAHARRLITIPIGCAIWCMVETTVAQAAMHDPPVLDPSNGEAVGTPFWANVAIAGLEAGALTEAGAVTEAGACGARLTHTRRRLLSPAVCPMFITAMPSDRYAEWLFQETGSDLYKSIGTALFDKSEICGPFMDHGRPREGATMSGL
jgi:hypothetical protein